MDNDGYISNGELFQVLAMKSTKDTHKKTFSFAASFIFVLPRCWKWWLETTWKTPSCSRWSIHHITCTCRFFVWKMKKRQQQQKMKALLCLSAIKLVSPFLDCGQDNSLPRQGQHRQDQLRGVLRGRFFLDVPISKSLQVVGNTDIHTKMVVEVWVGSFVSEARCKMKQSFAQKWKQPH